MRNGLGPIGGGSLSQLSKAFGLGPNVRRDSGFEDGSPREKRGGLIIGRSRAAAKGNKGDGGSFSGGDSSDAFEDRWSPLRGGGAAAVAKGKDAGGSFSFNGGGSLDQRKDSWAPPRRDEVSAVELPDTYRSDSLDDLDPFRGLQGTLDFNFAKSVASVPGLAESMGFSGKRKGRGFVASRHQVHNKKNNEVSISTSGSSTCSEDDDRLESHVVNPLFVGPLKTAVERRPKPSG